MFTYQLVNEDALITVLPKGELVWHVCNEIEDFISGRMGPGVRLSFNMRKVSFLDSAGVGFLLQMKNLADRWKGSFEMRHLPKRVKLMLERLALIEYLNVVNDEPFVPDVKFNALVN